MSAYTEPWHTDLPDVFARPPLEAQVWTPKKPLVIVPSRLIDASAPVYGWGEVGPTDNDLLSQHDGVPMGQQIVVRGRVTDSWGRPARDMLVEIWQANASGKYVHDNDPTPMPLDPNFTGAGRTLTDADGWYSFTTIKPGSYPWMPHPQAWRAEHIHFGLTGRGLTERYVTQMQFPGDPLLDQDPVVATIPDQKARERLLCRLDWEAAIPGVTLGYRWDIVLGGMYATPEH
ncbi:MAG TPA: protocatechuate 3,4-dioxygenase subunit beta [Streptomyces sp.]|uniref:dioxygenase family protein n=1 Tax=Streptomyces sp. TaxID=1931 RepID=UPI002B96F74E|nr:protocatechuate 3,4-dioxygenase subunit beta [Streptomyces sp.]HWU11425.1 protocatechuate 3,4-dioxygenase subunit beta [Streptomyces sp.]